MPITNYKSNQISFIQLLLQHHQNPNNLGLYVEIDHFLSLFHQKFTTLLQTLLFVQPFPFRDGERLGCWCPDFELSLPSHVSSYCRKFNCIFRQYTHFSFVLTTHSFFNCSTQVNCCAVYWNSIHHLSFSYGLPKSVSE